MNEPTNDSDLILPYDDCDLDGMSESEAIEQLIEEGYTEEEAKRMIGDYDADDDYCYGEDDLDRDVPDFIEDGDFE
jgi:hypothetical protein